MSEIQNVSRRVFIRNIGLASGGLILGCNYNLFSKDIEVGNLTEFNPNLFVQLNSDGSLIIVAARS
jgi:isoquinoline 1-oxidoreductase subunit beta